MYYENLFCGYFTADVIHNLLCGYAQDYAKQLINIYEPVLLAALCCTIAGTDLKRLDITECGAARLYRRFVCMPNNRIAATIQNAAAELVRVLDCPQRLSQYLQASLPIVVSRVQAAAQEQTLRRVFILPDFPKNKKETIASFGYKMDDEQYRRIIEEIGQCRYAADKLEIIKRHILSLADLEDVLLDAYLTGEETNAVLRRLNLSEISALVKKYHIKEDIDDNLLNMREQYLRQYLNDYLSAMTKEQQDAVIKTSKQLEIQ